MTSTCSFLIFTSNIFQELAVEVSRSIINILTRKSFHDDRSSSDGLNFLFKIIGCCILGGFFAKICKFYNKEGILIVEAN